MDSISDKMYKLVRKYNVTWNTLFLADAIIADGWVKLPCKIGDIVYETTISGDIKARKVKDIIYTTEGFRLRLEPWTSYEYFVNETVFFTYEEAEQALKERNNNA